MLTSNSVSDTLLAKGDSFKCDGTLLPAPLCEEPFFFFRQIGCFRLYTARSQHIPCPVQTQLSAPDRILYIDYAVKSNLGNKKTRSLTQGGIDNVAQSSLSFNIIIPELFKKSSFVKKFF